jgi:hypothetical protein
MANTLVSLRLTDNTPDAVPLEGAVVRLFDGNLQVAEDITDVNGDVEWLLPESTTYEARVYLFGVKFARRIQLVVGLNILGPWAFSAKGEPLNVPRALDPQLCRVSGFIRDLSGAPLPGATLHFRANSRPFLLGPAKSVILSDKTKTVSQNDGWVEIDLVRNICYTVLMTAFQDEERPIVVPDQASAKLGDLLYPHVTEVNVSAATASMSVGYPQTFTITPAYSDGRDPSTAASDLDLTVDDPTIAFAYWIDRSTIGVQGKAAGTTTVRFERLDRGYDLLAVAAPKGNTLVVTVT